MMFNMFIIIFGHLNLDVLMITEVVYHIPAVHESPNSYLAVSEVEER